VRSMMWSITVWLQLLAVPQGLLSGSRPMLRLIYLFVVAFSTAQLVFAGAAVLVWDQGLVAPLLIGAPESCRQWHRFICLSLCWCLDLWKAWSVSSRSILFSDASHTQMPLFSSMNIIYSSHSQIDLIWSFEPQQEKHVCCMIQFS
jgi:hypothetical protein